MIRARQPTTEIVIDLTGPDGNAYYLLGLAGRLARQLDLDHDKIVKDMTSGDYEHLLEVFDKTFPFVILER